MKSGSSTAWSDEPRSRIESRLTRLVMTLPTNMFPRNSGGKLGPV